MAWNRGNSRLYSVGLDGLVQAYEVNSSELRSEPVRVWSDHGGPVMKVAASPSDDWLLATASQDGTVRVRDERQADPVHVLPQGQDEKQSVVFHPLQGHWLFTGGESSQIQWFDLRQPTLPLRTFKTRLVNAINSSEHYPAITGLSFNRTGTLLLASPSLYLPTLYGLHSEDPLAAFAERGFTNRATIKQFTFAGSTEELVIAGSDDYRLYSWRLPEAVMEAAHHGHPLPPATAAGEMLGYGTPNVCMVSESYQIITGHRSNPNCLISHPKLPLLFSSGVEKAIKMHSPHPLPSNANVQPILIPPSLGLMSRLLGLRNLDNEQQNESDEDPETIAMFDFLNARERTLLDLIIVRARDFAPDSDESIQAQTDSEEEDEAEPENEDEDEGNGSEDNPSNGQGHTGEE